MPVTYPQHPIASQQHGIDIAVGLSFSCSRTHLPNVGDPTSFGVNIGGRYRNATLRWLVAILANEMCEDVLARMSSPFV